MHIRLVYLYLSSDTYLQSSRAICHEYIQLFSHVYTDRKERVCHFLRAHLLVRTSLFTVVFFLNCNTFLQCRIALPVFINHNYDRTHAFFSLFHNIITRECTNQRVYNHLTHTRVAQFWLF